MAGVYITAGNTLAGTSRLKPQMPGFLAQSAGTMTGDASPALQVNLSSGYRAGNIFANIYFHDLVLLFDWPDAHLWSYMCMSMIRMTVSFIHAFFFDYSIDLTHCPVHSGQCLKKYIFLVILWHSSSACYWLEELFSFPNFLQQTCNSRQKYTRDTSKRACHGCSINQFPASHFWWRMAGRVAGDWEIYDDKSRREGVTQSPWLL